MDNIVVALAAPPANRSSSSLRRKAESLDRSGTAINQVGTGTERVPIDLLQSLYFAKSTSGRSSPALGRRREYSHGSFTEDEEEIQAWPESVIYTRTTQFPNVKKLAAKDKKRILITGGAGFVGGHLVDRLMASGHDVTVLDNLSSGSKSSISHWMGHPNFEFCRGDVVESVLIECDQLYSLACPASPKAYSANAVKTLKTCFMGTMNMLGLAKRVKARFLLASTSEIYGSPEVHPQKEDYWGCVNPVGTRSCYDEGKRVAEALTYGYHRQDGVDVRVSRIFNCYGPRMNSEDGRLVSNFVVAALRGEPIRIYGDGSQTRSLLYIQDLVDGLIALMASNYTEPVNLGTEDEFTVLEWATKILDLVDQMREAGELPTTLPSPKILRSTSYPSSPLAIAFHSPPPTPDHSSLSIPTPPTTNGEATDDEKSPSPLKLKRSPIIFEAAVLDDPQRRRANIDRAREVLGWEPRWGFKAGLRETILYFAAMELEASL